MRDLIENEATPEFEDRGSPCPLTHTVIHRYLRTNERASAQHPCGLVDDSSGAAAPRHLALLRSTFDEAPSKREPRALLSSGCLECDCIGCRGRRSILAADVGATDRHIRTRSGVCFRLYTPLRVPVPPSDWKYLTSPTGRLAPASHPFTREPARDLTDCAWPPSGTACIGDRDQPSSQADQGT